MDITRFAMKLFNCSVNRRVYSCLSTDRQRTWHMIVKSYNSSVKITKYCVVNHQIFGRWHLKIIVNAMSTKEIAYNTSTNSNKSVSYLGFLPQDKVYCKYPNSYLITVSECYLTQLVMLCSGGFVLRKMEMYLLIIEPVPVFILSICNIVLVIVYVWLFLLTVKKYFTGSKELCIQMFHQ